MNTVVPLQRPQDYPTQWARIAHLHQCSLDIPTLHRPKKCVPLATAATGLTTAELQFNATWKMEMIAARLQYSVLPLERVKLPQLGVCLFPFVGNPSFPWWCISNQIKWSLLNCAHKTLGAVSEGCACVNWLYAKAAQEKMKKMGRSMLAPAPFGILSMSGKFLKQATIAEWLVLDWC